LTGTVLKMASRLINRWKYAKSNKISNCQVQT
jgi:hypothetical protein